MGTTTQNGYEINRDGDLGYITLSALKEWKGTRHGFTIKGKGDLSNLRRADFASSSFRKRLLHMLGLPPHGPVITRQVHGDGILTVKDKDYTYSHYHPVSADAIITDIKGLPIALLTADCLPLLLYHREAGVIGIAHAGRKGTLSGIASNMVQAMEETFRIKPERMQAALGPAIGPCCYEVGSDVAQPFMAKYKWWEKVLQPKSEGKSYLDLYEANRLQLEEAGVGVDRIISPNLCTSCHSHLFHSYRRDDGIMGHIFSFIMLNE